MIISHAQDAIGTLIDAYEQSDLADWPAAERQRIVRDLRAQHTLYDAAAAAVEQARTSKELTPIGQRAAVERAVKTASAKLQPHDAALARLADTIARTEAQALTPSAASTPAEERDEEFARAKLTTMDHGTRTAAYLDAIRVGNRILVNAVERAIKADIPFAGPPFISAEGQARARDMKIAVSPLKPEIDRLQHEHAIYQTTVGTTRGELRRLAERHGLSLVEV